MSKVHILLAFSAIVLGLAGPSCHPIGPPEDMPARNAGTDRPVIPSPSTTTPVLPPPAAPPPASGAPVPAAPQASQPKPGTAAPSQAPSIKPAAPSTLPKPAASAVKDEIPTAQKAPGRPGYVLSPYTGKLMLVRGVPSGVVVPDQTSPDSGKKFRVP